MLSKLNKYTPILLQHPQRPIRTSLMTILQRLILYLDIVNFLIRVQGDPVTVSELVSALLLSHIFLHHFLFPVLSCPCPQVLAQKPQIEEKHILININKQRTSHPSTPLRSLIPMPHIITKAHRQRTYAGHRAGRC